MDNDSLDDASRHRTFVEDWSHEELEAGLQILGHKTRLEVLTAIYEAHGHFVPFSEIKERVSIRDSGNLTYHLDKLKRQFIDHDEQRGYTLRAPAKHALRLLAKDSLSRHHTQTVGSINDPCPFCSESLQFIYDESHTGRIECPDCETIFKRFSLPQSVIQEREPAAAAVVVDARVRSDFQLKVTGVCPYCQGDVRSTLIPATEVSERVRQYDRDESDGSYIEFTCDHCTAGFVNPAAMLLYTLPEAVSFFLDHGERLRSIPFWWAFSWNADGGAVVSEGGTRVQIAVALDDESFVATVDEQLQLLETTRTSEHDLSS